MTDKPEYILNNRTLTRRKAGILTWVNTETFIPNEDIWVMTRHLHRQYLKWCKDTKTLKESNVRTFGQVLSQLDIPYKNNGQSYRRLIVKNPL